MKYGAKKTLTIIILMFLPILAGVLSFLFTENYLFFFAGAILSFPIGIILANALLRHPIIDALLGKGNLCYCVTESGQWIPFIVKPESGYIRGVIRGLKIEGIMDRSLLNFMGKPASATSSVDTENNKIVLTLDIDDYKRSKHYSDEIGFFIYSMKLRQFLNKEMFAALENETFSKHMITYTAYKVRELTSILRDFSRTYVDLYKENKSFWEQPWFKWVIIGVVVIIAGYFILPHLLKAVGPVANSASSVLDAPTAILRMP